MIDEFLFLKLVGVIIVSCWFLIGLLQIINSSHIIALLELKIRQCFCKHEWDDYGWGPLESEFQMCKKCWKARK